MNPIAIISALISLFTGKGTAETAGVAIAGTAQLATLAGMAAAVVLWLKANGDDIFIALTYKDLAFWGVIGGVFVFFAIRLAHKAPPPPA